MKKSMPRSAVHEISENSICEVFLKRVMENSGETCVAYRDGEIFKEVSWGEMGVLVHALAAWLRHEGVVIGDRTAIFSSTRYEWWICDMASLLAGAVDVPVYATSTAAEAGYVLSHSGACVCFAGNMEQAEKILKNRAELTELKKIVVFDYEASDDPRMISLQEAIDQGMAMRHSFDMEKAAASITGDTLATIIYTSGTTGPPKGVMITHGNIIANIKQAHDHYKNKLTIKHEFLSFLPLSHALERMGGYYGAISSNTRVSFARDISTLLDDLKAVRPTSFIAVPRMFEKIYYAVHQKVRESGMLRRFLFERAMKIAGENVEYMARDRNRRGVFALRYALARRLVFSRIIKRLGMDRLRFVISGGNSLSDEIARFFMGLDIRIIEGYGLTETSPAVSANRPDLIKPGAVGAVFSNTEVRISGSGEILIKGPQVMLGYYRDEEATRNAFTPEGFFKSGDLGYIDDDGYLHITGRIKDIIITSGGKNISPMNIETNLMYSKYIEQAAVIGNGRGFLTALIVPDYENLEQWAARKGICSRGRGELIMNKKVRSLFDSEIARYQKDFSKVEQIKKYTLMESQWTQESGELTPSMKVKRRVINERYVEMIEEMYAGDIPGGIQMNN